MDLPEIVDVARNFTVMVRVQGPDPKGLKMRNHAFHQYNNGKTTLSASGMLLPGSFGIDPAARQIDSRNDALTFSGSTVVVTVASVFEPFLSLLQRENMSQDKPNLIPGVQIDVMLEGRNRVEHETKGSNDQVPHWLSARLFALVDVPASSMAVQSLIQASSGSLENCWEVGWSLASYSDGPQTLKNAVQAGVEESLIQRQSHMVQGELRSPNSMGRSTSKIALLAVCSTVCKDLPNLNIAPLIKRGDLLLAMGSPFGVLSPVHFFNSISVGYVANCYPSGSAKRSLLMADIRCLPGMEGGPVFGEDALLFGLLTRPLRQKTTGAEIQLVIPWEAIATACSDLLLEEPQNGYKGLNYNNGNLNAVGRLDQSNSLGTNSLSCQLHKHANLDCPPLSPIEKAMISVCLVTIDDRVWASGVLLNKDGLILTNAHLLEPWRFQRATAYGETSELKSKFPLTPSNNSLPSAHDRNGFNQKFQGLLPGVLETTDSVADGGGGSRFDWTTMHQSIRVRLDHRDPWIWCDAKVLYVSKGPLDIALLQLGYVPDQLCPIIMDFSCPPPGSKIYVIGHGLFGPRCEFFPSVCVGVVAKVVEVKWPLLHGTGQRDNALGCIPAMLETTAAVHPGGSGGAVVNSDGLMIGLVTSNARHGGGTTIPHLNFSIPCAALEPVFKFSKDMSDSSLLEDLDKPSEHLSSIWALMPPLSPKGPSLPYLPLPVPADINKDGKGSQFAKFISEKQEVLKRSIQLGKMERLSIDSTRCKL
ncbi:glyoxysomal processing protease, glyoxysomal isoform X2 [Diospyros lotus]|uniref:glyoxysomal processing protease, glyoxysomal isoform X2 n=1 Tax=Diospyros lotus TaxID=55363 RepID=UPI00225934F7|nr:glyoxysomal processing protease, glyoxysomal isoform X2 [Diospyros lotus]